MRGRCNTPTPSSSQSKKCRTHHFPEAEVKANEDEGHRDPKPQNDERQHGAKRDLTGMSTILMVNSLLSYDNDDDDDDG